MTVQAITTDTITSEDLAERFANLTRTIGANLADLADLADLAAASGYELPDAVELAAAVMPRPGEPDPEPTEQYAAWLDQLWQTDRLRADLICNVLESCIPSDETFSWPEVRS